MSTAQAIASVGVAQSTQNKAPTGLTQIVAQIKSLDDINDKSKVLKWYNDTSSLPGDTDANTWLQWIGKEAKIDIDFVESMDNFYFFMWKRKTLSDIRDVFYDQILRPQEEKVACSLS